MHLTNSRLHFISIMKKKNGYHLKVDSQKIRQDKSWISHVLHCEWVILSESYEMNNEMHQAQKHIALSTFNGISWRHFFLWIQIRRHIVYSSLFSLSLSPSSSPSSSSNAILHKSRAHFRSFANCNEIIDSCTLSVCCCYRCCCH